MKQSLAVWMNGERVGYWNRVQGNYEWIYDQSWVESPRGRPLSLSLPFLPGNAAHRGEVVLSYFENLLPDRPEVRNRLRDRFRASSAGAFDLLAEIGRDCIGAVQLLKPEENPPDVRKIEGQALSDEEISRQLATAGGLSIPGMDVEDFRISLAGAQEKTAFLKYKGKWCKPMNATPSTHIFKLPLGGTAGMELDLSGSLENEYLCSRILTELGIPAASTEIASFGKRKALVVERFDRQLSADGSWIIRLPVEDFCQISGLPPEKKYERDGGPGIDWGLKMLSGSEEASENQQTFLKAQILFWLLAASDGHAKNFSIFIGPGGTYQLAPLYDVISVYPWMGKGENQIASQKLKMAMAVRGKNVHYRWESIQRRHWEEIASKHGLKPAVDPFFSELSQRVPEVMDKIASDLPPGFSQWVFDSVSRGFKEACRAAGSVRK